MHLSIIKKGLIIHCIQSYNKLSQKAFHGLVPPQTVWCRAAPTYQILNIIVGCCGLNCILTEGSVLDPYEVVRIPTN
jgi:hypothetical protein